MSVRSVVARLLLILAVPVSYAQQPRIAPLSSSENLPNIGPLLQRVNALKSELRDYHACTCKCGCYASDLNAQSDKAIALLRRRTAHPGANQKPGAHQKVGANQKLALVLDIDETALSNWAEIESANFEYNRDEFNAWIESAQAPAIAGTLRLYEEARKTNVAVFFLTGRPESQRASTEANLRVQGFGGWESLIMRSQAQKGMTALAYKSAERRKIVAAGYRIVLNVGDQWSDLNGKPQAEYSVKYPDPFYLVK
jgi:acid phosphatase